MIHPGGMENLISAILKNAISEYDNALNYVEKHPEPKTTSGKNKLREKENEIFDCERFFHSTWFEWLCDINPDKLIDGIKKRDKSQSIKWDDEMDELEEENRK